MTDREVRLVVNDLRAWAARLRTETADQRKQLVKNLSQELDRRADEVEREKVWS